ncbi:hypothetical protein CGLAUT_10630 [Corynebacterium glaucum]|uniref:hypothetical protein n=1 Tax=Corynebacterium glaucum TaxID=187491 RepID=UPI0025B313AB|nr:hypothetical protein [Corynebacterium glaucum]WJZ08584.1 hypothetical protein CGLAUT_10630 [Corynebacterium glaucum]
MKRFRAASIAAALSAALITAPIPFASAETPNAEIAAEENKNAAEDTNPELIAAEAALERAEKKLNEAKAELTKIEQDAIEARKAESEALKKATGDQAGKFEAARIDNEHERSKKILAAMEKVTKAQADYDRAAAEVERVKAGPSNDRNERESINQPLVTQVPKNTKGSATSSSELSGVNPVAGGAVIGLAIGIIAAIFSLVAVTLPMLPQIAAAF